MTPIIPVILCGGSGTRLWPLSRKSFPKQFVPLIDGTPDALLVASASHVEQVKQVVALLDAEKIEQSVQHRKVARPWGTYDSVDVGERHQVKRITVRPGAKLSLQMHHHRAEHWIVVKGTALVTRGEEEVLLSENQSTYIPLGVKHRPETPARRTWN